MFSVLLIFSFSLDCPEGTPYLYDEDFEVYIQQGKWYYFHTNIQIENQVPLLVIAVKSDKPVDLYSSNAFECPDGSDEPFLNVTTRSHYTRGNNYYRSPNGIISIGIKAHGNTRVFVKLEGQHKIKNTTKYVLKLILIFLIMITITGFLFFNVILPNEMKQKKRDETDNDIFKY